MRTIMPAFARYPGAGTIIGRLITGYGDLEFSLAWAVAWLIGGDEDVAFKVMYRSPGEEARLRMADALVRGKLVPGKTRTRFEQAIAAMHECRKIRNHYAHCQWGDDGRGLWFVDLQEIANKAADYDLKALTQHVVDMSLLREQEEYFCFVADCISWLTFEGQAMAGRLSANHFAEVHRSEPPPPLHR